MTNEFDQPEFVYEEYPVLLYQGSPPSQPVETSEQAAQSIKLVSRKQREMVLNSIRNATPFSGLTDDELEELTGLRHQSASARRRECVLLGLVEDSGKRRKTRSGRQATVWVAT